MPVKHTNTHILALQINVTTFIVYIQYNMCVFNFLASLCPHNCALRLEFRINLYIY